MYNSKLMNLSKINTCKHIHKIYNINSEARFRINIETLRSS